MLDLIGIFMLIQSIWIGINCRTLYMSTVLKFTSVCLQLVCFHSFWKHYCIVYLISSKKTACWIYWLWEICLRNYMYIQTIISYCQIGVINYELGRAAEAMAAFDRALALDPTHRITLYNSALLLTDKRFTSAISVHHSSRSNSDQSAPPLRTPEQQQQQQQREAEASLRAEAAARLRRLLELAENENGPSQSAASEPSLGAGHEAPLGEVHFQLAMIAGDEERHLDAEHHYLLALQVCATLEST